MEIVFTFKLSLEGSCKLLVTSFVKSWVDIAKRIRIYLKKNLKYLQKDVENLKIIE